MLSKEHDKAIRAAIAWCHPRLLPPPLTAARPVADAPILPPKIKTIRPFEGFGAFQSDNNGGIPNIRIHEAAGEPPLPILGAGSQRVTFGLTDELALKVDRYPEQPYHSQNEREIAAYKVMPAHKLELAARLFDADERHNLWLIFERTVPFRYGDLCPADQHNRYQTILRTFSDACLGNCGMSQDRGIVCVDVGLG